MTDERRDELLWDAADGIARITFNRPAQRNALTWAMYDGLVVAIERINADDTVRAVILTGAGEKAFAAGTDIGQFREFSTPADLPGRATALARTVAGLAPLTLRSTKMALHKLATPVAEDEDLILMCYGSADFREGMDAFLAKRPPVWQGA